jgi:hypothetical protein
VTVLQILACVTPHFPGNLCRLYKRRALATCTAFRGEFAGPCRMYSRQGCGDVRRRGRPYMMEAQCPHTASGAPVDVQMGIVSHGCNFGSTSCRGTAPHVPGCSISGHSSSRDANVSDGRECTLLACGSQAGPSGPWQQGHGDCVCESEHESPHSCRRMEGGTLPAWAAFPTGGSAESAHVTRWSRPIVQVGRNGC